MNQQKSFILYDNYYEQIVQLSNKDRGTLLLAIFEYRMFGEARVPLSKCAMIVFTFIRDTMDRDREAYEARCEYNRTVGKKGGRPKKETNNPRVISKTLNDNDNENDIDNDIDIDNDMGFGSHPLLARSAPTK